MKTNRFSPQRHRSQNGSAVVVVMALLGIILALVTANAVSVHVLKRELQLLDHKQQHRWEQIAPK
jgi:hypothetical protein